MKKLSFLLVLIPRLAFGAVAHDASGTGTTGSGITTLSYSHTVTGSNPLIVCSVSYSPGGGLYTISSITYNGVGLTQKATQTSEATAAKTEIWFLVGPATGAHTAQVNFSGAVDRAAFDCSSFSGAASLGTATSTNDIVTGLSCTVPTNGLCYDVAYNSLGASGCQTRTPGGSATKRFDICANGGASASIEHFSSTISASASMTWDHDSGAYEGQISVPINEAVAAGGGARRKIIINQ